MCNISIIYPLTTIVIFPYLLIFKKEEERVREKYLYESETWIGCFLHAPNLS